jgi:hypothetical protein
VPNRTSAPLIGRSTHSQCFASSQPPSSTSRPRAAANTADQQVSGKNDRQHPPTADLGFHQRRGTTLSVVARACGLIIGRT